MVNLYLMLNLDAMTWMRFGVWMIIGVAIYFLYGIKHSKENAQTKEAVAEKNAEDSHKY